MMKYIICIFLGVLLLLGYHHVLNKDSRTLRTETGTIIVPSSETNRHIPDAFVEQPCQDHNRSVRHEENSYKNANGVIGNLSVFRATSSFKTQRLSASEMAIQMLSSFDSLLPQKKRNYSSFKVNPTQYSYRYFIYALKRILI